MKELIIWLVLLIVFVGMEAATLGLTSIWFAGGALVAMIAAALSAPVWLQIVLFLLTALALLVFTRPIAVKYFNKVVFPVPARPVIKISGFIGGWASKRAKASLNSSVKSFSSR